MEASPKFTTCKPCQLTGVMFWKLRDYLEVEIIDVNHAISFLAQRTKGYLTLIIQQQNSNYKTAKQNLVS